MKRKDFGESHRQYELNRIEYELAFQLMEGKSFGRSVLDIGAGKGEFADLLSRRGYHVTCVDGMQELCEDLQTKGYKTVQADLEEEVFPFPDNSFDLVVSLEVIEHLWNTDHYLKEIQRVVRPDGFVLLTTPNYNFWSFRVLALVGRAERFLTQDYHKKLFTVHSLPKRVSPYFKILERNGRGRMPKLGIQYPAPFLQNLLAMHMGILCKPRNKQTA